MLFAYSVIQKVNRNKQIDITIRKVTSNQLTAAMVSGNFNERNSFPMIKLLPLWIISRKRQPIAKMFLFDILAIVKPLRVSAFFMTLSSADLKWNELIINKRHKWDLWEEDIGNFTYHETCCLLNSFQFLLQSTCSTE